MVVVFVFCYNLFLRDSPYVYFLFILLSSGFSLDVLKINLRCLWTFTNNVIYKHAESTGGTVAESARAGTG